MILETIRANWLEIVLVLGLGAIGGLVNALWLEKDLALPRYFRDETGGHVLNTGFLRNVLIGAVASLLTWAFGVNEIQGIKQMALCLLAGIGGTSIISNILQRMQLDFSQNKILELSSNFEKLVNKLASEEKENGSEK